MNGGIRVFAALRHRLGGDGALSGQREEGGEAQGADGEVAEEFEEGGEVGVGGGIKGGAEVGVGEDLVEGVEGDEVEGLGVADGDGEAEEEAGGDAAPGFSGV